MLYLIVVNFSINHFTTDVLGLVIVAGREGWGGRLEEEGRKREERGHAWFGLLSLLVVCQFEYKVCC
jgi:hypothetical protein